MMAIDRSSPSHYGPAKMETLMRRTIVTALLSLAAFNLAHAEDIAPERVLDGATGDWNKDGRQDLALLVAPKSGDEDIGIYIYLRDGDHDLLRLAAGAPGKVSGNADLDGLVGRDPTIKALPNGSIAIHSQNDAVGRDRWEQTLTLAYRNNTFVVAGYTYSYNDTLDPKHNGSCDYNVLTGKVSGGNGAKAEAKTIEIKNWQDDIGQKACGLNLE